MVRRCSGDVTARPPRCCSRPCRNVNVREKGQLNREFDYERRVNLENVMEGRGERVIGRRDAHLDSYSF